MTEFDDREGERVMGGRDTKGVGRERKREEGRERGLKREKERGLEMELDGERKGRKKKDI